MNKKLLSAVYGILQVALDDAKLLDKYGRPDKKAIKQASIHSKDVIELYKWLSDKIQDVQPHTLEQNALEFNKHAEKLHDDYLLNMTLLGIFLLQNYIWDMDKFSQGVSQPKLDRIQKHFTYHVEKSVYKDSRIAANNLYRLYTNKLELTKEVREAKFKRVFNTTSDTTS